MDREDGPHYGIHHERDHRGGLPRDARGGKKEGILFLDEFNCESETARPIMLQLLQSKTFGPHTIPDGWMLVLAGIRASTTSRPARSTP